MIRVWIWSNQRVKISIYGSHICLDASFHSALAGNFSEWVTVVPPWVWVALLHSPHPFCSYSSYQQCKRRFQYSWTTRYLWSSPSDILKYTISHTHLNFPDLWWVPLLSYFLLSHPYSPFMPFRPSKFDLRLHPSYGTRRESIPLTPLQICSSLLLFFSDVGPSRTLDNEKTLVFSRLCNINSGLPGEFGITMSWSFKLILYTFQESMTTVPLNAKATPRSWQLSMQSMQ